MTSPHLDGRTAALLAILARAQREHDRAEREARNKHRALRKKRASAVRVSRRANRGTR